MSSPIADLKNSKTVKKYKPIKYKERSQRVWCADSVIDEFWKRKQLESKEIRGAGV